MHNPPTPASPSAATFFFSSIFGGGSISSNSSSNANANDQGNLSLGVAPPRSSSLVTHVRNASASFGITIPGLFGNGSSNNGTSANGGESGRLSPAGTAPPNGTNGDGDGTVRMSTVSSKEEIAQLKSMIERLQDQIRDNQTVITSLKENLVSLSTQPTPPLTPPARQMVKSVVGTPRIVINTDTQTMTAETAAKDIQTNPTVPVAHADTQTAPEPIPVVSVLGIPTPSIPVSTDAATKTNTLEAPVEGEVVPTPIAIVAGTEPIERSNTVIKASVIDNVPLIKPTTESEEDKLIVVEALESELRTSHSYDTELLSLRKCLSIHHENNDDHDDHDFIEALKVLKDKVSAKLDEKKKEIWAIQEKIANKEREWQALSSTDEDDVEGLKDAAGRGWPAYFENKDSVLYPYGYAFDFFISYRVSVEAALARELRLRLKLRGLRAYLDVEELEDGEDWRNGFVQGLKNSRVMIPLVSKGCLDRMSSSSLSTDNVLLEWETGLAAMERGFCLVLPVFIGIGDYDFSKLPKSRPMQKHILPGDLICRQSAYTTVMKLKKLEHLVLPDKSNGWTDDVLEGISSSIEVFRYRYDSTNIDRARFNLVALADYFSVDKGGNVENLFESETIRIARVPAVSKDGDAGKVASVLKANSYWKEVTFEDQDPVVLKSFITSLSTFFISSLRLDWAKGGLDQAIVEMIIPFLKEENGFRTEGWGGIQTVCLSGVKNAEDMEGIATILVDALQSSPWIKKLDFTCNVFSKKAMATLIKGLPPTIESLNFHQVHMMDDALNRLATHLTPTITTLILSDLNFSDGEKLDDDFSGIKGIFKIKTLKHLNLKGLAFNHMGMADILIALKEAKAPLETLILDENDLSGIDTDEEIPENEAGGDNDGDNKDNEGEDDGEVRGEDGDEEKKETEDENKVQEDKSIKVEVVTENTTSTAPVVEAEPDGALADAFGGLMELADEHEKLGDPQAACMIALADFLRTTTTLQTLSMKSCKLGQTYVDEFCKGLAENKTLCTLDLAENYFDDTSLTATLEALSTHPKLTELDLSYQRTPPRETDLIFSKAGIHGFLTKSTTINNLFLNGLRLSVEAFEPLCNNESIIEIQLNGVTLTDDELIQLAGYVEKAKSLQRLHMNNLMVDHPELPEEPEKEGESTEETAHEPQPDLEKKTTKIDQDDIWAVTLVTAFEKNEKMTKLEIDSYVIGIGLWHRLNNLNKKRNGEEEDVDPDLNTTERAAADDAAQDSEKKGGDNKTEGGEKKEVDENKEEDKKKEGDEKNDGDEKKEEEEQWGFKITNVIPGDNSETAILKFAEEKTPDENTPAVGKPKSLDSPVVILSTLKSNILRTAASLAEQNVEYTKAKEVEEAVDYIEQAERGITAKHYKFIMDWGEQDRLGDPGVYFLSAISASDKVPEAQEAIIREIMLRIKVSKAPEAADDKKEEGDAQAMLEPEHAATDYIQEQYFFVRTISTQVAKYPTLKHVENVKNMFQDGCLYVLFLSDKILDGIDHDIDTLWNALNFWDQLMYLADKHLVCFLPIYLALENEGFGIFDKLRNRIKNSLYLLQSRYEREHGLGAPYMTITRGLDIITRLFQHQAPTISEMKNCATVTNQIIKVLSDFQKKSAVTTSDYSKSKAKIAEYLGDFYGEQPSKCPITKPLDSDDLCEAFATIFGFSVWKQVEVELALQVNDEGKTIDKPQGARIVIENLHKNKDLEDFILTFDDSYHLLDKEGIDVNMAALGETLTKSKLLSCTIDGYMSSSLKAVAEALKDHSTLKTLVLANPPTKVRDFGDMDLAVIGKALATNTVLEKFKLCGKFDAIDTVDGMRAFADGLKSNKTLKSLTLTRCNVKDDAMEILAEVLKTKTNIEELDLSDNAFLAKGMKLLLEAMKGKDSLRSFNISENIVEEENVEYEDDLEQFLRASPQLIAFELAATTGYGRLDDRLPKVLDGLMETSIQELNLSGQKFTDEMMGKVIETMQRLPLKKLSLQDCNMSPENIASLAEALESKRESLEFLNMSLNEINNSVVKALSELIKKCTILRSIDLTGTRLSDEAFAYLKDAMFINRSIIDLKFDFRTEDEIDYLNPTLAGLMKRAGFSKDEYGMLEENDDELLAPIALYWIRNKVLASKVPLTENWKSAIDQGSMEMCQHLLNLPGSDAYLEERAPEIATIAARTTHLDLFKEIHKSFPESFSFNDNGYSEGLPPLYYAVKAASVEWIDYLFSNGVNHRVWEDDSTAFYIAVGIDNNIEIGDLLLKKYNADPLVQLYIDMNSGIERANFDRELSGFTVLHIAARKAHVEAVEYLMVVMEDIHILDYHQNSALHIAAEGVGKKDIKEDDDEIEEEKDEKKRRKMLQRKKTRQQKEDINNSAGYIEIIQILVAAGLKINAKNTDNKTPLTLAIEAEQLEIAKAIRALGGLETNQLPSE
ncbi:hypothetical protein HDU76_009503 [Blyttiomyces sp. JEL0837]|nr:hypothetical protein HDU76_009503 [Blyttiomyces sp. JEL0837]